MTYPREPDRTIALERLYHIRCCVASMLASIKSIDSGTTAWFVQDELMAAAREKMAEWIDERVLQLVGAA